MPAQARSGRPRSDGRATARRTTAATAMRKPLTPSVPTVAKREEARAAESWMLSDPTTTHARARSGPERGWAARRGRSRVMRVPERSSRATPGGGADDLRRTVRPRTSWSAGGVLLLGVRTPASGAEVAAHRVHGRHPSRRSRDDRDREVRVVTMLRPAPSRLSPPSSAPRRARRSLTAAVGLALLAAPLAACSADDGPSGTDDPSPSASASAVATELPDSPVGEAAAWIL